ncbi:MAG: hypothetical protein ACW967_01855 [Candidatus Hodarchaeales archaeon]|jgi:hypothetical protein
MSAFSLLSFYLLFDILSFVQDTYYLHTARNLFNIFPFFIIKDNFIRYKLLGYSEQAMRKKSRVSKASSKPNAIKNDLKQLMMSSQYSNSLQQPLEKKNYANRSFIRLPKNEKIRILKNDLYREAYRLAEFLTADSAREGFVR